MLAGVTAATFCRRYFAPDFRRRSMLWPRWVCLRAIGFFFFSAFVSLAYQIHGLIGPHGLRPAQFLFDALRSRHGLIRYWELPSLLWLGASDRALTMLVACGIVSSLLLIANVAPKISILACLALFVSFVSAAQEFSEYQSDGMLLEAAAIGFFLAPRGWRPKLGESDPPTRAALFLLKWEWFRIYFESGLVKMLSGDPSWRDFTAMDHYYENGPLPTWIGWYVQQLPHWYHALTAFWTLALELVVIWLAFFPRRIRIALFFVVSIFQIGIILTSNYCFLNYLVLAFGILLVDDDAFRKLKMRRPRLVPTRGSRKLEFLAGFALSWIFAATLGAFLFPDAPVLGWPAQSLERLRIANRYGLFAVMTPARYEIEFQGSMDGVTFTPYPYRFKPQALNEAPGIYAPYQPRFEWNLWFASLSSCEQQDWVMIAEARLLQGEPSVLRLFRDDPFHGARPKYVRTMTYQYWMTNLKTKRATGNWWRRDEIAPFCDGLSADELSPELLQTPGAD